MPPALVIAIAPIAAPLIAFAAIAWRRILLMALPILAILNGLAIPAGGSSLRLDQLVACLLVIPLGAQILTGTRRLRVDATVGWLAAILAVNLLASLLHSPARAYSLLQCANLASVWLIYVLLLNFLDTRAELEAFFHGVLWAGIVANGIGIVAYLLAISGFPVGGAEVSRSAVERLTTAYGAYGTMVEPNIFGSFAGSHLVLAVALLLVAARYPVVRSVRLLRWLAGLSAAGLLLSFTRAAWIGAAVGLIGIALFSARALGIRVRPSRLLIPLGVGVAAVVALLLLPGDAGTFFRFKLLNLVNLESQTGLVRLFIFALALQQTAEHPVIGWGTYTFAALAAQGSDFQQFENWRNLWIGNYLLLALHDTGVIGLLLWIGLLSTILARGLRTALTLGDRNPIAAGQTFALTAAVASLLIPYLATTGFSLGYSWLLIGLLGAHCRLAAEERASTAPTPTEVMSPAT